MDRLALDRALITAHAAGDHAALVTLYAKAAEIAAPQEAAFYLTQAYVFALESNDPRTAALKDCLVAMGADQPNAMSAAETG